MEINFNQQEKSHKLDFESEPSIYINSITINTLDKEWANRFFSSSIDIEISGYNFEGKLQKRYKILVSFSTYIGPNSRFPVLEVNNKVYFENALKGRSDKYTVEFKLNNTDLVDSETITLSFEELNASPFLTKYSKFENIVRKILSNEGYKISNKLFSTKDEGFDFTIVQNNKQAFVEIKLYESKMAKPEHLRLACENLLRVGNSKKYARILIVSNFVAKDLKKDIYSEYGVHIYDLTSLISLAQKNSGIYFELQSFLIDSGNFQVGDFDTAETSKIDSSEKLSTTPPNVNIKKPKENAKGRNLCKELNDIPSGRTTFRDYENKCIEILKYLFQTTNELSLWKEQLTSDDGLHRKDLLCRINKTNNVYWNDIYTDFHSRYVVFEFKNYSDPISQKEVYTTEKYLFIKALHSVAIVFSPKGASDNAFKAANGALREAGKLILLLDNKDLCEMLRLKDSAEEPSILISQRIDEMLIKITR